MSLEVRMPYLAALEALGERRREELVVTTMTSSRVWANVSRRPELDLSFGGCMGKASSLALGLAMGRPERQVWVLDGDGSLVMNLGTLITIAQQAPANLTHFTLENGVYEVTGGQPVPGAGQCDLTAMARAAGYRAAYRFATLEALREGLDDALAGPGPCFVTLVVEPAGTIPRVPVRPTRQALAELHRLLSPPTPPSP